MKRKYTMSLKTAQQLINTKNEDFLTSSVHCCYYAVFQKMKYVLSRTNRKPISLIQQDKHNGQNSHEYILTEIRNRIEGNPYYAKSFAEEVRLLRGLRKEADYKEKIFTLDECLCCMDRAEKLLRKLDSYFGNI